MTSQVTMSVADYVQFVGCEQSLFGSLDLLAGYLDQAIGYGVLVNFVQFALCEQQKIRVDKREVCPSI